MIISQEAADAFDKHLAGLETSVSALKEAAHLMMLEALLQPGLDHALTSYCSSINRFGEVRITYRSFGQINEEIAPAKVIAVYQLVQEMVEQLTGNNPVESLSLQLTRKNNALSVFLEATLQTRAGSGFVNANGKAYIPIQNRVTFLHGTMTLQQTNAITITLQVDIPGINT